jgi:hypothetical protein
MNANESQTISLAAGQVLTVTAPPGATGSVVRLSRLPGGGNAQSITAINGADLSFGAYADVERFEIICTAGELTFTCATPDPSLVQMDAEAAVALALKMDKVTATAENDFIVSGATPFAWVKKTLAQVKTILGLGSAAYVATSAFDAAGVAAGLIAGALAPSSIALPEKTPVNAVAASGTLTVTSGGNQIAADYKVLIDAKEYTFKAALTPAEGEVLVGANDTASLLNLLNAIKHTGTPDTDYKCAAAHPTVDGTSSNATTLVVTAKTKGVSTIATTKTGAEISWAHTTLYGGVNGTVGIANETCADASYIYHTPVVNTIADANWRRIALGSVY